MKKLIILSLALSAVACGSEPDTLEGKRNLLGEKQKSLADLREEIKNLEAEIADLDTTREDVIVETPVEVKELQSRNFSHFVELTGTISSKENIMISAEAGGRVTAIPAEEGQDVDKGEVLVRIENENVQNQLEEARAAFNLAKTTFERRQNLWDKNIGSEMEYLQAKNNYETARSRLAQIKTAYDNTIIKAPIDGTVDRIAVNEGEFVNIGSPIVRVVNLDDVEVEADISEEYLSSVNRGDTVQVEIPSLGVSRKAPVTFVSQVINPENRSFQVKVGLDNEEGTIKPNVLANLRIRDYSADSTIVVPTASISKDLRGSYVYVINEQGGKLTAHKKYIETGNSSGSETEVLEGLQPGSRLVTAGYNQLSDGQNVNIR